MRPSAPPEVAGRRFDYPTGYNLNTTARAYEPVSFVQLRRLADGYDLLRLVIETRKDQAARMKWAIKPREAGRLTDAKAAGMDGLKGHRSVGGIRASIYNAFPPAGCDALASFMSDFAAKHG